MIRNTPARSEDRSFRAVIFDMDGTLVESAIDFQGIRHDLNIPEETGILEAIAAMPDDDRARANALLLERELAGVRNATLVSGAHDVLTAIRAAGLPTALLTRNARQAMMAAFEQFDVLEFDLAWAREDGPIKPEPDGVLRACEEMGVPPEQTLCVGDFRYEIIAANQAGAVSVLLRRPDRPDFTNLATYVIDHLQQLLDILELR
jgi:HAD superfamily hydrolase (TIGR01509 family)